MFNNREEVGKLLYIQIKRDFVDFSDFVIIAILDKGVAIAEAFCKEAGLDYEVMAMERLIKDHKIFGICGEEEKAILLKAGFEEIGIPDEIFEAELNEKRKIIREREGLARQGRGKEELKNKNVVIISDVAIAGDKIILACRQVFMREPKKVLVAIPGCSRETYQKIERECDGVYVLEVADMVLGVNQFYK